MKFVVTARLGRGVTQDRGLLVEAVDPGIRTEPAPVELLGRVDIGRGEAGRIDLVPLAVVLAPERRAPRRVEGVERPVALAQPAPECGRRGGAEALREVAGVLVVDVPHRQSRMSAIAAGKGGDEARRAIAIGRAVRAVVATRAVPEDQSLGGDGQDLGMQPDKPGRRRRGRRREVDLDAMFVEQVDHAVEPAEVEDARIRLEL